MTACTARDSLSVTVSKLLCTYLGNNGVLADKDEEDEAASEKVEAPNDPEDKLRCGDTFHLLMMISMGQVVDTLKYPQDTHHYE